MNSCAREGVLGGNFACLFSCRIAGMILKRLGDFYRSENISKGSTILTTAAILEITDRFGLIGDEGGIV